MVIIEGFLKSVLNPRSLDRKLVLNALTGNCSTPKEALKNKKGVWQKSLD